MATIETCLTDVEIQTPANINVDIAVKLFDKHCFICRWRENDGTSSYKLCRLGKGLRNQIKWVIHPHDAEEIIKRLGMKEQRDPVFTSGSTYFSPKRYEK